MIHSLFMNHARIINNYKLLLLLLLLFEEMIFILPNPKNGIQGTKTSRFPAYLPTFASV